MTKHILYCLLFFCFIGFITSKPIAAQVIRDSSGQRIEIASTTDKKIDSVLLNHSPRKAAIRSAIIPGWGQVYNKKYWKLPIVYGALGTSAGVFFYNLKNYRDLRLAYSGKYNAALPKEDPNSSYQGPFRDSTDYKRAKPNLLLLSLESLRYQRNEFRRNIDLSVLAFALLWGLNVVDATVDAHLKSFDVSPDLSLRFKPGYSELGGTTGLSLVLAIK